MIKVEALSQDQIKAINRVNILHIIRQKEEMTKQEIAKLLKLSIPTITANVKSLVEEGLVEEAGVAKSTGGRKPMVLRFLKNARYAIGVNISPTQVQLVLMNMDYESIDEIGFCVRDHMPWEEILGEVSVRIESLIQAHNINKTSVIGIGLSLPGLVDEDQLILTNAPNIGVKDFSFKDFEKQVGIEVSIENEANVAAFAESVIGKAKDKQNLVYISITEGVGTGIIINNAIYKSQRKKAGEFGHMKVTNENRVCNCGRKGCWELYASKEALKRYYGDEKATLENIFGGVEVGEPKAVQAVNTYLKQLFIGIENIILGLNPEYVIVGGELGLYEEPINQLIKNNNSPSGVSVSFESGLMTFEDTKILFTDLGNKGSLVGAGILPFESLFNYKTQIL